MEHATYDDVNLILRLYDMRREERMRAARTWFVANFRAKSIADFNHLCPAGSEENAMARQVTSYWDMVATFVVQGVLNEALFFSPGVANEMLFVFAKVQPFLKEIREKTQSPMAFANVEKAISKSKSGKERFAMILKRVEGMRKSMKA